MATMMKRAPKATGTVEDAYEALHVAAGAKAAWKNSLTTERPPKPRPSLRACLDSIPLAGTSEERQRLRAAMKANPEIFPEAIGLIDNIIDAFSARPGQGCPDIDRPPSLDGLPGVYKGAHDPRAKLGSVAGELHEVGARIYQLLALAFEIAFEHHPEQFGTASFEEIDGPRDQPEREWLRARAAVEAIPPELRFGIAHVLGLELKPGADMVEDLINAVAARG